MTYPLKEEVSAEYALQPRIYLPSSTDTDTELSSARAVEEENENTAIIIVTMRATEITDIDFLEREDFIFFCVFKLMNNLSRAVFCTLHIQPYTQKRRLSIFLFQNSTKTDKKKGRKPEVGLVLCGQNPKRNPYTHRKINDFAFSRWKNCEFPSHLSTKFSKNA